MILFLHDLLGILSNTESAKILKPMTAPGRAKSEIVCLTVSFKNGLLIVKWLPIWIRSIHERFTVNGNGTE